MEEKVENSSQNKQLHIQPVGDNVFENFEKYPQNWTDNCDYVSIIATLNTNSTLLKNKMLDKLLTQIIDTKQNLWEELSQSLRKCFVSNNNEIFTKSLKLHHRLISMSNTTCDGYLSLLKSTVLLLNSRFYTDLNKSRILQTLSLVIGAHSVVVKALLHANPNIIDEIITVFVSVLTFKSVFEWFGNLDSKSNWLRNFAYGAYIRSKFFNLLIEKNLDFIKQIADNFLKKSENEIHIYGTFLVHLWVCKNSDLPLDIRIETMIQTSLPKLKKLELFTNMFLQNPNLLNLKMLDFLIEPLSSINRSNIKNSLEPYLYIFEIVTNIAKSNNSRIILSFNKLRNGKPKNSTNRPQKITDLTLLAIKENYIKYLPNLLDCCEKVYDSHPAALAQVNPTKLLENLYESYRLNWRNDIALRDTILSLFIFFYSENLQTLNILGCDNEILLDLFSFYPPSNLKIIINRLGYKKSGFEFLRKHQSIVKPYLDEMSSCEDYDYINLILFISSLKLTTRSAVAFLFDDDDHTVVDGDHQSLTLAELVLKNFECAEPTEVFLALLLLKVFITNLDLLLYFQANHQMQEKLKSQDEENEIIDAQSILRRDILHYTEQIGFVENQHNFFLTKTELEGLPHIFECLQVKNEDNELHSFLEIVEYGGEFSWVTQARRAFKNSLEKFDPSLFTLLFERMPKTCVYRKSELHWPPSDCVYYQLHPEDFSGISLIISYGLKAGLLEESEKHNEMLALLIKQSRAFLGHQPEDFSNFDWFVGIIYLICFGNYDHCKSLLINFTHSQVTSIVWATFGKEFDDVLQLNFYQNLRIVVEENTSSFQSLKMLGMAPDVLVRSWLNQCFFNMLKFEEICNFLALSALYPAECILYYMVAIFTHLDERICKVTHSPTVENILNMTEMSDFKLINYMDLIETLIKRYRNTNKL